MPEKRKYIIKGSDFRFQKKTYPEGSVIELTDEQYQEEKKRITLEPGDTGKVSIESQGTSLADEKNTKKVDKKK